MPKLMGNKVKTDKEKTVWVIVVLLLVLVLATAGILATMILRVEKTNITVISVNPDENDIEKIDNNFIYKAIYRRVPAQNDVQTSFVKSQWETTTTVDLFKDAYYDENGEITVKSSDGSKVIAPGTSNEYSFALKNTGNVAISYTLSLEGLFSVEYASLPFEVRLSKNGEWVIGSDSEWCDVESLEGYTDESEVAVGKADSYTIEWRWPFEAEEGQDSALWDLNDTEIGQRVDGIGNTFSLNILTLAEEIPGAVAVDEDGNQLYEELLSVKDLIGIALMLALVIGAIYGIIHIIVLINKKVFICIITKRQTDAEIKCNGRTLSADGEGRFGMGFIRNGSRKLVQTDKEGNELARAEIRFERKENVSGGASFRDDADITYIELDKSIRVLEISCTRENNRLIVDKSEWAAFDKNNTLYTEKGEFKAKEDGSNTAPSGMKIDKKHIVTFKKQ